VLHQKATRPYCNELLIEVNLVFSFVPRPLMTAMMASEMPAGDLNYCEVGTSLDETVD
jgi:hypothetical protein